jgi:8-oxo-dGTP diphosphatase
VGSHPIVARRVSEIDWARWTPVDPCTLLLVVRDERALFIRKKRGFGAGKINAPGGRIEAGESPLQAAIREVQEELLVTPTGIEPAGELSFQFVDGYSLHVHVFRADDCVGEAGETDEAIPLWTPLDEIPFDQMWADDELWIPLLLKKRSFSGRFIFDGDEMVDHVLELGPWVTSS